MVVLFGFKQGITIQGTRTFAANGSEKWAGGRMNIEIIAIAKKTRSRSARLRQGAQYR
jgi:hypothetical protein